MSLIRVRVRVCLLSEQDLDNELMGDEIAGEPYLSWRKIAIRSEMIKEVIQYDREKTLITTYEGDKYFVKEPHAVVFKKWTLSEKEESESGNDLILGEEETEDEPDEDDDDDKN